MGYPEMMRSAVEKLKEKGYYRFVAMFTWAGQDDTVALQRLSPYIGHKFPPQMGIDPETAQFYYFTGARTVLVIGYTNSGAGLQRFSSSVTFGTDIKANIYHAVEGWEVAETVPK